MATAADVHEKDSRLVEQEMVVQRRHGNVTFHGFVERGIHLILEQHKVADQLLFLCRQDALLQSFACEEVATDVLLEEVVGNMQLVAQEKGVSLKVESKSTSQIKRQLAAN